MIKPELLAPAGSMDALHAAVDNGADAVYLGVGTFNARANAQNFVVEDLPEIISYAHLHSVRIYLTLNTLLRDDELDGALSLARTAYDQGVDALIVQDLGLLKILRQQFPYIPVHASTQMNLYDKESIRWAKDNNISRIVLPREMSAEEISVRTREASRMGLEIEVFIHGALCVCYSGLCLFSAMNGNGQRSGNRGLCAQPCRTLFELESNTGEAESSGRLLSVKDQSALPFIPKLMEAGVHSLKIEGRMKEPAYVAATVRAYREYIDRVFAGENPSEAASQVQRHLLLAFNRGGSFTTQYMQGEKKDDLPAGKYSGRFGLLLGIIVKKNARAGTLSLRLSAGEIPVRGDYLSIRADDQEISSFPIGKVEKMGDLLVVMGLHPQMIEKIPDGAHVYQMSEIAYTRDLLQGKAAYKTPVRITLQNDSTSPLQVNMQLTVDEGMWKGTKASVKLIPSADTAYPMLSQNRISEQISKAKSSPFDVLSVQMDPSFHLCAPVSFVNEMRREGFTALEQAILEHKHPADVSSADVSSADVFTRESSFEESKSSGFTASCCSGSDESQKNEQHLLPGNIVHVNYYDLRRILPQKLGVRADFYSFSVYDLLNSPVHAALEDLHAEEPNSKFLIWLPGAYKDSLLPLIDKAVTFMQNAFPDSYAGTVTSSPDKAASGSWISSSANLYNHEALCDVLNSAPFSAAPSYELKDQNLIELLSFIPNSCFAQTYLSLHRYGRIEWMQSEFCPVGKHEKACKKCRDKDHIYSLQILSPDDREPVKGKNLPVITHAALCTSEILGPLHPSAGTELLNSCKMRQIPVAHTIRFFDEAYDVRRHIANEIMSDLSD